MKRVRKTTIVLCLIFFSFLTVSCAGVKCHIAASKVDPPVSFTSSVYDANGAVVKTTQSDVLKHFKVKRHFVAMVWRLIPLTDDTWDVSEDLRKEIMDAKGNAIVNLIVFSEGDWWWILSSLVPIIPSSHLVVLEGDVVHIKSVKGD